MRRTSNYLDIIVLFDLTHMMSMVDHVTISVEIPMIDNGCSLEKKVTELMLMNLLMVLYLNINQVNSFHGPLT